ncbi:phenylalanine--tRNA ligase subunit beta [Legionella israelensis]|uniref:Phenylalanine--tRNA ligase beta subunit n=1 Tax=Legionella israelensis TaxID=454 RepID=A0A0W0V299_9GAMM|nr:phenylalanine--tRNA ligase subunit beta [Legionella israelensis]KTD14232.1 phenylalanyl-tRNA synthetase, beta subunit [Legionella israelensis]QBS10086.1 phenylalanine--tRNA ligase subunit beta [Legionella israelensis]SCX97211.1 phenylalanyl-tRNA synthetase beta subunit [Legionella israelensis DSM 19235]STX59671.1 phenylalanyl-tRNA synthetase, beta subunit [Legionella israelensis]
MKISELWLREWVNPSLTVQQLASQLTMAGLEVDAVTPVASEFNGVVVAEVMKTEPHPQADKLTLCEVNAGGDKHLKIVCGAANVRAGLKVALATVGAKLPGGIKIKEAKLRGEVSQGMLCSATELGMAEQSEGIIELNEDAPVGESFRDYLKLNDFILDIDLTPNRADCFSVLGVAREIAALNQSTLKQKSQIKIPPAIDDAVKVHLNQPESCSIYCGRIIKGINPQAKTPVWMSEKLRRSGIRSVHPVVDVTNYVMLELGQPMHAFDLEMLSGDISVRMAMQNETLELLDGQKVSLDENVLLIADEKQALAMAGIMGGASSAVQETTQDIFLESAFFNPLAISGVARRYGLCTDSSQRFERGVEPELQGRALETATELLLSIVGGEPGPMMTASDETHKPKPVKLMFQPQKVKQLTGVDVPFEHLISLLQSLGMKITETAAEQLEVIVPLHRFDISIEEDLVEEIIRLYGYDKLPAESPSCIVKAGRSSLTEKLTAQLSRWFSHRGYHETISYSFVDPELQETLHPQKQPLSLLNPLSSELSQMRMSLWPGLIASMVYNAHRQSSAMKLFEVGVVFNKENEHIQEQAKIAGLLMGERGALNWAETTRNYDFYDLKGELQALFNDLKIDQSEFIAEEHPALHPGKTAMIRIAGKNVGWIGALHPGIVDALSITHEVILFELLLSSLTEKSTVKYKAISKYPQVRRDLSFLVAEDIVVDDIKKVISETVKNNWLKSFDVFDLYKGKGVVDGKKSLGVSLTFQDAGRTLTDIEINELINAIIKKLEDNFAIILRD